MVGMIHELVFSELFQQLVKLVNKLSCIITARSLKDVLNAARGLSHDSDELSTRLNQRQKPRK